MLASFGLMIKDIAIATIMEKGARIAILRSIWYAFWMLVTSVVSLVTRLEDENLSMLAKEKVWILSYMAFLRFLAKPVAAFAPNTPPRIPKISPRIATTTMIIPVLMM